MRLGASTAVYGCSFPGCVDTVEALLRLLLRLRTIHDLGEELDWFLDEDDRLRPLPLPRRVLRWTRLLQLFFCCTARLVVTICDHLLT